MKKNKDKLFVVSLDFVKGLYLIPCIVIYIWNCRFWVGIGIFNFGFKIGLDLRRIAKFFGK